MGELPQALKFKIVILQLSQQCVGRHDVPGAGKLRLNEAVEGRRNEATHFPLNHSTCAHAIDVSSESKVRSG